MAKKNSDEYWKQREQDEQDWINENVKNDDDFNEHLQEYYQELIDRINKDISNQLIQYAEAEGVNLSKARQRVSDEDVKAFENKAKSIVKKAEKIRKRKGFVSRSDFSKEINARLRLYNATMRINRLEMLKAQIGLEIMDTNLDVHDDVDQRLSNDYLGELKRQAGILAMYESQHNYKDVAKVIMAQTKNATFSERIWASTDVLKANLDRELTQAIIRGENPRKLASRLRKYVAEGVGNVTNVTDSTN